MSRPKLKVGAGNGHLRRLAQTAQKLAQHQAQAAELLEAILTLEIVTGMKSDHVPIVIYYRRPAANRARATLFTWVCSFN